MTHFIKIAEQEFREYAIKEFNSPEFLYPVHGQELVIRQKNFSKKFELHLYTSIGNDGETRDIGEDAIRLVLYDAESLTPISGTSRINRVEGVTTIWDRLKIRLDELYKIGQSQQICSKCSAHLVERENRSNGNI